MNCNCIKELEDKLQTHYQPDVPVPIQRVRCDAAVFALGDGLSVQLAIPFSVHADCRGYSSQKGKATSMRASFCPFCGVSTKPQENPA